MNKTLEALKKENEALKKEVKKQAIIRTVGALKYRTLAGRQLENSRR